MDRLLEAPVRLAVPDLVDALGREIADGQVGELHAGRHAAVREHVEPQPLLVAEPIAEQLVGHLDEVLDPLRLLEVRGDLDRPFAAPDALECRLEGVLVVVVLPHVAEVCRRSDAEEPLHGRLVVTGLLRRQEPAGIQEDPVHTARDHLLAEALHVAHVLRHHGELDAQEGRPVEGLELLEVLDHAVVDPRPAELLVQLAVAVERDQQRGIGVAVELLDEAVEQEPVGADDRELLALLQQRAAVRSPGTSSARRRTGSARRCAACRCRRPSGSPPSRDSSPPSAGRPLSPSRRRPRACTSGSAGCSSSSASACRPAASAGADPRPRGAGPSGSAARTGPS